jgi:hypothetical protein
VVCPCSGGDLREAEDLVFAKVPACSIPKRRKAPSKWPWAGMSDPGQECLSCWTLELGWI